MGIELNVCAAAASAPMAGKHQQVVVVQGTAVGGGQPVAQPQVQQQVRSALR